MNRTIKRNDAPRATGLGGAVTAGAAALFRRGGLTARAALMLLVTMLTTTTAGAQGTETEGDWHYSYDSGTNILTIDHYVGTDASVTTPTMLGGHAVTAIGNGCFNSINPHTYLTSVTISEGITTIGRGAFDGCSNLASVSLPNSLVSIIAYAFYKCSALTSITIPSSVTSIGMWAFAHSGLTDLYYTGTKEQWNNVTLADNAFLDAPTTVHWRCTATFDMQGHGTAPSAQTVYQGVANALAEPTARTASRAGTRTRGAQRPMTSRRWLTTVSRSTPSGRRLARLPSA